MIITNCAITMCDSELLRQCVMSKDNPEFKKTGQFHTGLDIVASNLFTVYRGRIVFIGNEDSGRTVVVQTGSSFCVCYKRLKQVTVNLNDLVEKWTLVGVADKYVHVEVYTKDYSDFPVRIGNDNWYKADANMILDGSLQSLADYAYKQNYADNANEILDETVISNMINGE